MNCNTTHYRANSSSVPGDPTGGGYAPIGATLLAQKIYDSFARGSGLFQHGHTYLAHPLACAAALAVQKVIREQHLLDNVQARGMQLGHALHERFGSHPFVGDIRGRGLFWGIELVAERLNRQPFDPGQKVFARIRSEAMARGLMVYPMPGTVDGKIGDHVLLAPPFIVNAATIDTIVQRLGEAVDAATMAVSASPA